MGYRSDVRIVTTIEGYKKLNEFVKNYIKNTDENNLLENCDIKRKNDKVIYFGWDYVKWYEDWNTDVDAIMKGLEHLKQNNYSYKYARLGESYDDFEEKYYESSRENEVELEFPIMIRAFDDTWFDYFEKFSEEMEQEESEEL